MSLKVSSFQEQEYYTNGCLSNPSNNVEETVELEVVSTTLNNRIQVYPNPTTGKLTITTIPRWRGQGVEQLTINSVEFFDVYGRKQKIIFNFQFSTFNSIDISHLSAGIYFVKISTEVGVAMRKVVKQ